MLYILCACEAMCVGETTQRLTQRIKQHIPDRISNSGVKRIGSGLLVHFKSNHSCIPGDKEHATDRFRMFATRQ